MNQFEYVHVKDDGSIVIPSEIAARFGLISGQRAVLEERNQTLVIKRSVTSLARIYVEPTNLCNLTCTTCMRNVWDEPLGRMLPETYTRILEALAVLVPPPEVFFGGIGEPLFHPAILEMVRQTKALGCRTEMITNGMLLDGEVANALIQSGLDFLWVSVDGATPESYTDVRLGAALPQVLENVRRLRSLRDQTGSYTPQLGFAFVAMRRNVQDLPEIIRMGLNMGVKRFSVSNVLAHNPELRAETLYDRSLYRSASEAMSANTMISLPRIDWNDLTRPALAEVLGGNHRIVSGDDVPFQSGNVCPFIARGSTSIRWDGAVSPCLALLHTHDTFLDDRIRRSNAFSLGNVNERSLIDIWNDAPYINLREALQAFAFSPCVVCNSCEMANDNLEDCFGNTLPACGGCLWAQGLIQCP